MTRLSWRSHESPQHVWLVGKGLRRAHERSDLSLHCVLELAQKEIQRTTDIKLHLGNIGCEKTGARTKSTNLINRRLPLVCTLVFKILNLWGDFR